MHSSGTEGMDESKKGAGTPSKKEARIEPFHTYSSIILFGLVYPVVRSDPSKYAGGGGPVTPCDDAA